MAALAITVVAVGFAADVSRAAHGARSVRRSENRSFGQLVNTLIARENAFDGHLAYLLEHGSSLTRVVFTARLSQLAAALPGWAEEAVLLRRPVIAHQLNVVAAQVTEERADDTATILNAVAATLHLPWTALSGTGGTLAAAQAGLQATAATWSRARYGLVREPGLVHLEALTTLVANLALPTTLATLAASPSLQLHRSAGISAVEVTPTPLPAPAGELLLIAAPTTSLAATVTNAADTYQPVALTVTIANAAGVVTHVAHERATLGPLSSIGFSLGTYSLAPGSRGTLVLTLNGVPAGGRWPTVRRYRLVVAPSGTGG